MSGRPSAWAEQLAYYRAVAGEYEDHALDVPGQDELLSAIDSFRPTGTYSSSHVAPGLGPRDFFARPTP